jgi:hypothetical protein
LHVLADIAPSIDIVRDGLSPPGAKATTLKNRANDAAKNARRDNATLRGDAISEHPVGPEKVFYPRSNKVYDVLEKHAQDKGLSVNVHYALTEGDDVVAKLAIEKQGLILSSDTDFTIFATPHGYLDLDSLDFEEEPDGSSRVSGIQYHPQRLADKLNQMVQDLPTHVARYQFEVRHLPDFALLVGNDQTKALFEKVLKPEIDSQAPCQYGLKCNRDECTKSHDRTLLRHFPCTFGKCYADEACEHGKSLDMYQCAICPNGDKCRNGGFCVFMHDADAEDLQSNDRAIIHHVLGQKSPFRSKLLGRFAIAASVVCSPGGLDAIVDRCNSDTLQQQVAAGRLFYDPRQQALDNKASCLQALRTTHEAAVWDRHHNKLDVDTCTLLLNREYELRVIFGASPKDNCSPHGAALRLLNTKFQLSFFWCASCPYAEWPSYLTGDVHRRVELFQRTVDSVRERLDKRKYAEARASTVFHRLVEDLNRLSVLRTQVFPKWTLEHFAAAGWDTEENKQIEGKKLPKPVDLVAVLEEMLAQCVSERNGNRGVDIVLAGDGSVLPDPVMTIQDARAGVADGVLPALSVDQVADRPHLKHLDLAARRRVLLAACDMSDALHDPFIDALEQWSADAIKLQVFHEMDPPETAIIALWALRRYDSTVSDSELLALATQIVCADQYKVLESNPDANPGGQWPPLPEELPSDRGESSNVSEKQLARRQRIKNRQRAEAVESTKKARQRPATSCWHKTCQLPGPGQIKPDCGTADYRRRSDVVALWSAINQGVRGVNCGLGAVPLGNAHPGADLQRIETEEPFYDGSHEVMTDKYMVHALMMSGCSCKVKIHADLASRLVDLAKFGEEAAAAPHVA